jgi:hypothetical protein
MLILILLSIIGSSNIIINDKLLNFRGVHLMPFVFTLNVEGYGWNVLDFIIGTTHSIVLETSTHGFVHVGLAVLVVAEVDAGDLFEIINKLQTLGTHHFLISWAKHQPWVS